MRFKQYLTELFQKNDFKISTATDVEFEASFEVGGKEWSFQAGLNRWNGSWDVIFEDEKRRLELTGMAKEEGIEVYAYVISILKYFIKRYNPEIVNFEGFETRQHKFYQRLVKKNKRLLDKLGYEVDSNQNFIIIYK